MKKTYFLVVTPNYPRNAKIEPALCKAIECRRKDAPSMAADYERTLNGGDTYDEAFKAVTKDNYESFMARKFFRVFEMTYAQARDYGSFSSWPCLVALENNLPVS